MTDFEALLDKNKSSKSTQKYPIVIQGDNGEDITISPQSTKQPTDLPGGAELTSTQSDMVESFLQLKDNISVITEQVKQALADHQPEEWGVEFSVGFKGKAGIPIIAQGEANGALKITAKWKKGS